MTRLAHLDGRVAIEEFQLFFAIGVMRLMAADARSRIRVASLPARQKDVKVIVEVLLSGDIRVAFQAVGILDRMGMDRRLRRVSQRPCHQILGAQH